MQNLKKTKIKLYGVPYPALMETAGVDPPEFRIFRYFFLKTYIFLHFPIFSK